MIYWSMFVTKKSTEWKACWQDKDALQRWDTSIKTSDADIEKLFDGGNV